MPDKPTWYGRLDEIIRELEALPYPWVDRLTLEQLLGVGRRRAQQILACCMTRQVGASIVADRQILIDHLRQIAAGDSAHYEQQRRKRLGAEIERLRQDWISKPRVLVEAPPSVVNQKLEGLPPGVEVWPAQIIIRFQTAEEAMQKMLALAMALGNDYAAFEALTTSN